MKFFRYDALWHWEIMSRGYEAARHGNSLVSHYSITWPTMMKLWASISGVDRLGMMFFNCGIFGLASVAVAFMARKASLEWWKPVAFLCCFPTAYFANTIYNEPIFLLFTAMSVAFCLGGKLPASGVWAGLAVTIRVNAWAQVAAWGYSLMTAARPRHLRQVVMPLAFILICASIQPVAIWYWRGSPVAHYEDLKRVEWMASPQMIPFKEPSESLYYLTMNPALLQDDNFMYMRGWGALFIVMGITTMVWGWVGRWIPPHVLVQGAMTVLGLGLLEQAISVPRYMMAFMPFYFLAAKLPPWALGATCSLMFWAQCDWSARFIRGAWAF